MPIVNKLSCPPITNFYTRVAPRKSELSKLATHSGLDNKNHHYPELAVVLITAMFKPIKPPSGKLETPGNFISYGKY